MNKATVWSKGERDTVIAALNRAATTLPDEIFLDFKGETYSFADIDKNSTCLAHELAGMGVARGQTVVTILDTSVDPIVLWFAINKLGAIWVPINTAYRGEFLRHQIIDSGARILVCEDHYLERVLDIAGQLTGVARVLVRGAVPAGIETTLSLQALDDHRGTNATPIETAIAPEDLSCLLYTSGTTGPSKGCMISHNYLCNVARQTNADIPPHPREVAWTCLPLFHLVAVSCVVVATLLAQNRAALSARFSVSTFWDEIEQSGAGTAHVVATVIPLVAHAPDTPAMLRTHGQLRAVTGVPFSTELRRIWTERFGVSCINSFAYGQTEVSKIGHYRCGDPLPPAGSAGKISPDFEVRIVDANDFPVPADTVGEIIIRPTRPNIIFEGYWRNPQHTMNTWRNLWMHTGDLGRIDKDGYLYFVDRKKDYLRNRGENISSFEVETTFMQHPAISEAALHGMKIQEGEEDIKLTAVLRENSHISEAELCLWAIDKLPYFAVPRFIEYRNELPKNPTGRVLKYKLREEGVHDGVWDRELSGIKVRKK